MVIGHRHHGNGSGGGEPVGFVIATGVVADVVGRAVEEGDGTEAGEAGSGLTWIHKKPNNDQNLLIGLQWSTILGMFCTQILVVSLLLSLHIQQTESVPQLGHALWAHGNLGILAVLHQSVADAGAATNTTGNTRTTRCTGKS